MAFLTGIHEEEARRWMYAAGEQAKRALCHKAKCGTVIVQGGEVVGEGFNAPPLNGEEYRTCGGDLREGKSGYDRTCCMHAEWRAVMDALRLNPGKLKGAKLYFVRVDETGNLKRSGEPYCTVCSRLALDVGISHFLLWQDQGINEYSAGEYNRLSYEYKS